MKRVSAIATVVFVCASLWAAGKSYDQKALARARALLPPDMPAPSRPGDFEEKPDENGTYIYEASSLKPLVEGAALEIVNDDSPDGVELAKLREIRREEYYFYKDNEGGYWKLGSIPEGDYWMGILAGGSHNPGIYLNGRVVQLANVSDGMKLPQNIYLREFKTGAPTRLRKGDEIAVMSYAPMQVARLVLYPKSPVPGRHYVAPIYDPYYGGTPDTALAVNCEVLFLDEKGDALPSLDRAGGGRNQRAGSVERLLRAPDGRPAVQFTISNPLPTPVEVDYSVDVKSYYRIPVGGETGTITLEPHARLVKRLPFDALEDEMAFSADMKVKVGEPADETAWRKRMRWPDLDWISFFPGIRQGLPWPDTFDDFDHRRLEFGLPVKSARKSILLDAGSDVWRYATTTDWKAVWPTAEELEWRGVSVPCEMVKQDPNAPRANSVYYRRTFHLSEEEVSQDAIEIFIRQVSNAAELYVNGVQAGAVRGANAPIIADVTSLVRPGENELVVVSHNLLSVMDPQYIDPDTLELNINYLDAPGHWFKEGMGLGRRETRNVELLMSPRVAARNLQIIPSTRQKDLRARFTIVNNEPSPVRIKVKATVLDSGNPVLELGEKDVEIKPGANVPVEMSRSWPDARWWCPSDPHLYVMAVEIRDSGTGKQMDLLRDRFGFRESWVEGPHIMLNGMPIRPQGYLLGYRERPNHMMRGTGGTGGPDYCDEIGMMGGEYVTHLSNSASRHNVESESFWKITADNAMNVIMLKVNHPSIIRWDISNEWLEFLDHPDPMVGARRFKNISDMIRQFDPTRWTATGGERDIHGLQDHFDFHYATPYAGAEGMRGHHDYLPDGQFWRELDKDFIPGAGVRLSPFSKDVMLYPDKKMMFEQEYLWKVGILVPPGSAEYAGENVMLWNSWDYGSGPSLWMWKQRLDGHRDVGMAAICGFRQYGMKRRAYPHQNFIVPQFEHHAYSGTELTRKYAVLQDLFRTCDMTFSWTLRGPDGKRLDGGEVSKRMGSAETLRGDLRVKLPDVQSRTTCTLLLELASDGKTVMAEERDIDVWPSRSGTAGHYERKLHLFDPKGETAKVLEKKGVKFEKLAALVPPGGNPDQSVLIVGENVLDETNRRDIRGLADFVEAGGRLLLLGQTVKPSGLPADTGLDSRHWASQCYVRAGSHPLVSGFSDWDFHFWAGDRSVTRGGYLKAESGASLNIVESFQPSRGRERVEQFGCLVEQYRGKGLYLLCQLPLIAKFADEPMADEMLSRSLNYVASQKAFYPFDAIVSVLAEANPGLPERLKAVDAIFTEAGPDDAFDSKSRVILDAASVRPIAEGKAEEWKKAIHDGAIFVISGATPDDEGWISKLANRTLFFAVPKYPSWDGRGMRDAWTPFTAGLSQLNLFWKERQGNPETLNNIIEPFQDYSAYADGDGVTESIWPGAMLEIKCGKGVLVIDQRNLYTQNPALEIRANRCAIPLVLGMGGEMRPAVETPEMPAGIGYKPIDLSKFANRAFADETPEDGQGGWSDQGAGADLRQFPTHNRRLGGVPFVFSEGVNKCVVLRNPGRPFPERLPESVMIPIEMKVAGFYFLHATAYGGRPSGIYNIIYEDGTEETISLILGINIHDWVIAVDEFPKERGTRSVLAWTGSTPRFKSVGIYRMEWVNPHPEKTVKSILFKKDEVRTGGVPILMGLTAAIPATDVVPLSAADREKAGNLAKEAAKALSAGDTKLAKSLSEQALAIDDQCDAAYAVRCDLAEKSGSEDEKLVAYQEWIDSGTQKYFPFNKVGEIHEKRGNRIGALNAYTRSLELEWNQPPIIEAKSRLEQRVE